MATVEISEVSNPRLQSPLCWGGNLDAPHAGATCETYNIDLAGWVLGKESPAASVRVLLHGSPIRQVPVTEKRPDVEKKFGSVPEAARCGFRASVSALGVPSQFELTLQVVLQSGAVVPWLVLKGRRHVPWSTFRPALQPLMLTTLGRTGSTWLTCLLGQHPQIVTYRPFQSELRIASYWLDILKDLSEPASYLKSIAPTDISRDHWWLGAGSGPLPSITDASLDPEMRQWLGRDAVEALVAFCQARIDAFYKQAALVSGRPQAAYFAEKFLPNRVPDRLWELYPEGREVILVRDFRDVACSIFAFSQKVGSAAFGRKPVQNDEEYILQLGNSAAALLRAWSRRSDKAHLLRYEDLMRRRHESLQALLIYLGVDADAKTVEETLERATALNPELQQGHKTTNDAGASIGRWQRDLQPSLRAVCEEVLHPVLAEFGYADG
ncbi:MAG TPA: sulfotransferase [Gemmataceae bacterium]|nr:sulfotransferase [Gemmataceae bacterium]